MKPVLTFTDYIEERDEFVVTMEILAKIGDEQFVFVSPKLSETRATDAILDRYYRMGLEDIFTRALQYLEKSGQMGMNVHGMTLMDKMSFFDIKQTVVYNNALHQNHRETNILFAGF
ncbi:hypothetical protein PQD71_gp028 [Kosakonia phage Kc263]|uniref:Uncharacterized protein n=1 Tax=Kosakonia phage Kc263 TaxID=2863194 RepID=A0AAE7WGM8_9CAUD|nr:hypothetical protein PQD71_gp028 [Kosakonia phage Kc263]QYN79921.1 hypothetical protein [Kosakonia phage Kc263]